MSSGVIILPAVNRNLPRIVAQSPSGILAYACRYHIYFIDGRSNPPLVLDSKFISGAHPGKIIALSFCKYGSRELLASVGDDREVKIWDVEAQMCVKSQEVKDCCRVLEWIYGSPNTLVYPSDFKTLAKWNFERGVNGSHKVKADSGRDVSQIVSNEKSPHLLAIGFTNGTITILDIAQETTLQRLKVHSNEITSLSWSLVDPNILLSASLDLSLRVWKMGANQPIWSYYMSVGRQNQGRRKNEDWKKIRFVGICHPTNANAIICSNLRGDVGEIDFAETQKPKFENEKPKFSYYYQGSCDLNCKSAFAFFGVSVDEGKTNLLYCFDIYKVTLWNVTTKSLTSQIPFMSQFVYDLSMSNANPNLLAISNGEGILKVWNSQNEATRLDLVSVFVHFKTRINTTAWHPITENIIAYGTDEGRIGIIDIVKRKPLYSFETHHIDSVYSLSWGPCEKAPKLESEKTPPFYVYSVGGGMIYVHKENDTKGKALNFDDLVERPADLETSSKTHSEVVWRVDRSALCVGSYKGFIDIYDKQLVFLKRITIHLKTVEILCWHPHITYMSPDGSHLKSWIACAGNDVEINIVDTSNINEEENATQGAIKKLVGHKKRICSVCWSPHKDGFLVSASKDGAALVWDVLAGTIIATYLHHQDVVYSVQWNVFDQDAIYSGGQDGSVRIWKISEQKVVPVPDKAPLRKKMKKPDVKKLLEDENADRSVTEITDKGASKKESTVPESGSNLRRALFPHYSMSALMSREDNLDYLTQLADILSPTPAADLDSFDSLKSSQCVLSDEDTIKFGLFADQLTALRMIENQGKLHRDNGDQFTARVLQLIAGNIQSTIEEAAENGQLTGFLVSMAPQVSHAFWLEMCEKYAAQLVSDHCYNLASNYFLACGKMYEAINVLAEKGLFLEGLALAKSRLPESDPVLPRLLRGLQKKVKGYSRVCESMCYLSANEPLVAAKTIGSTREPNHLRVAAYICRKYNLDKDADEYLFVCLEKCLMKYDYPVFKQLIQQEHSMQVYSALAAVHEALHHQFPLFKHQDVVLNCLKDMFAVPKENEVVPFWKGSICKSPEQSFIASIYQQFTKELQDNDKSPLLKLLEALEVLSTKRMAYATADVHITLAIYLSKFIILSIFERDDDALGIFLKIFEASFYNYLFPKTLCSLFFPMYISWQSGASRMVCSNIEMKETEYCNPILQSIHGKMAENITNYAKQPLETSILQDDLLSNLRFITERIGGLLAIKKAEEYLLAYFVSSIMNDLTKLIESKRELKLKCYAKERKTSAILAHSDSAPPTALAEDNLNKNIAQPASSKCDDEDIVNELLKFAEEKAKALANQGAMETNQSPNDSANSGDIGVENSFHADVVVQSVSNFVNSSTSAASIASEDTAIIEVCGTPFANNEEMIVDSITSSNNSIPPEKHVAVDELITSVSEVDVLKEECMTLNCDIIPEKIIFSSSAPDISEVQEIGNESTTNDIPEVDLSSFINITSKDVPLVDGSDEENIPSDGGSDKENILSDGVTIPGVDITNNENVISDTVVIPVADPLDTIHEITNTSFIADVDTAENDTSNADIVLEEVILKNDETAIGSGDSMSDFEQPSQKEFIPSSAIPEKIILPIHGIANQCSNEDIHVECLQSIDMFYNIVSFVTQNVCKDEFALLYYLKEKVKFLNHIRASEERNRFSRETKAASKLGVKANKIKKLQDPADLTEIANQPQENSMEESDVKVADPTVEELNLETLADLTEIVSKPQETTTEELDVKVADFIVSESKLDEPANLTEILNKSQESKVEELDAIVVDSTVDESNLQELAKSTEIVSQPQESKDEESDVKVADFIVGESNLDQTANLTGIVNNSENSQVEESDVKVVVPTVDTDDNIYAKVLEKICFDDIYANIVGEVNDLSLQSSEEQEKNLEIPEISPSSFVEDVANNLEQEKLSANVSQDHNYASQIEGSENSGSSHNLPNEICDQKVDALDAGVVPTNLQIEIGEISGLIDILEKNSKKFPYPNPFDVIPKILRALYDVVYKSSCEFVKEKLHELIHEIISWAKRYFVGDITFVCKICRKTSGV